jgi:hypothetical protein
MNAVDHVLIDVRENNGGNVAPSLYALFAVNPFTTTIKRMYLAPTFHDDPKKIADVLFLAPTLEGRVEAELNAAPSSDYSQDMPPACISTSCSISDATFPASAGPHPRAIVLAGPTCVSACDQFLSVMHGNQIAELAGMPASAGDSPLRYWTTLTLADRTAFDMTCTVGVSEAPGSGGQVLEGHPTPIDFPVYPNVANRGHYLDAVLSEVDW